MDTSGNSFEQTLAAQIKETENLRKVFADKLSSNKGIADSYGAALARLRELNIHDPRKGEINLKDYIRLVSSAPMEVRQAIAFRAPCDGVAKSVMRLLPHFGFGKSESLHAALLCIIEDCEQSFAFLKQASLPADDQLLVMLAAINAYPVFAFEEFKTQEVLYQTANTEDAREMAEIKRRFEQARGKKSQHIRKHIINYIPDEIRAQPKLRKILLQTSLKHDPFGTLETLREAASSTDELKSTTANVLEGISPEEKLGLVEIVAKMGMGLASNYLDLFTIPNEPEWYQKLQEIFVLDVVAGHSLFGVYAIEAMQNYPFELERIEAVLPRRITNSEAMEYLKRNDADSGRTRTYSSNEVAETVTVLQEKDVRRFLENLKWSIARGWKACVQDKKREIVFGDPELKVRNILFLVAHSLFEEEEKFENIFALIQKNHPYFNDDLPKIFVIANRYYFLDSIGLNVDFLFNRSKRPNGSFGTLIEEVSDYQVHTFLHFGMSIFIRVGNALFRDVSIAWTMLIGQCDGKIDTVFHEIGQLFDVFDTLLTIIAPVVDDLTAWVPTLIDSLSQDSLELPMGSGDAPKQAQLRITTRATIARAREGLNRYSLDALYMRSKKLETSPISIIQSLRMPRSKTDKLMTLLQNDPNKKNR